MCAETFNMQRAILALLLVFSTVSCTPDNTPTFKVSCDASGLHARIHFPRPFEGRMYANGHLFNPLCSFSTSEPILEVSLNFPLSSCGTDIQDSTSERPIVTNTIVVQQYPLKVSSNHVETVNCSLLYKLKNFWTSLNTRNKNDLELDEAPLEKSKSQLLNEAQAKEVKFSDDRLFYHLHDDGKNSLNALNPVVLKQAVLKLNSSFDQLNGVSGSNNFTKVTEFTFTKQKGPVDLMAHKETKFLPIASHKLQKRNLETRDESSLRQLESRNKLLKSTIKVMTEKLLRYKLTSLNSTQDFEKRALGVKAKDSPSPTDAAKDSPSPTDATKDSPSPTDAAKDSPSPTDAAKDSPSPTDAAKDSPSPTDAAKDSPSPTDAAKDSPSLTNEESNSTLTNETYVFNASESSLSTLNPHNGNVFGLSDANINSTEQIHDCKTTVITGKPSKGDPNVIPETSTMLVKDTDGTPDTITDPNSSLNKSSEPIGITTELNGSNAEHTPDSSNDCVPRLRFTVVTAVMGFIVVTLLLVCCGMALHMRKEKKKHLLDSFLLYNFY